MIIVLSIITLITFPVWLITVTVDRKQSLYLIFTRFFIRLFFLLNFILIDRRIRFNGITKPKNGIKRIYILNHCSIVDGLLLFLLPGNIKFMAKDTYAKIPIFGLGVSMTGSVQVKSGGQGQQLDMYYSASEILDAGYPLVVFAEGTRSRTGTIARFQNSAFMLAKEHNAEIVPVVLDTWNIIRPGSLMVRSTEISMDLLDTIKPEEFSDLSYKELSNMVRKIMIKNFLSITSIKKSANKHYYRNFNDFIEIDMKLQSEIEK